MDKINNAMSFSGVNWDGTAYGVLAVIVYDEDPNATDLIYMSTDGATSPLLSSPARTATPLLRRLSPARSP